MKPQFFLSSSCALLLLWGQALNVIANDHQQTLREISRDKRPSLFPSGTVRVIVAGRMDLEVDVFGRCFALQFGTAFSKKALVVNHSPLDAVKTTINAIPDGHTLLIAADTDVAEHHGLKRLGLGLYAPANLSPRIANILSDAFGKISHRFEEFRESAKTRQINPDGWPGRLGSYNQRARG